MAKSLTQVLGQALVKSAEPGMASSVAGWAGRHIGLAVDNTTGEVRHKADQALDAIARVTAVYRVYMASDTSAPCEKPYRMAVQSDTFEGNSANLPCGFFDLIGTAFPRFFYNTKNFPCLKYL